MEDIPVLSLEGSSIFIAKVYWVDCVVRLVSAQTDHCNNGALEIIVSVDTHGVGVHLPTINDRGECRQFRVHGFEPRYGGSGQSILNSRVQAVPIEAFPRLHANAFETRDHRPVG